jgi:acyl-CoA thioester hydrolase
MKANTHSYPVLIKETYLDTFGHMNNATYLVLYEEARWDLITKNGYGLNKIKESGLGPVILEIKVNFLKELRLREEIMIETQAGSYDRKIGRLQQKMIRNGVVCSTLDVTLGLFSLTERKLVAPTPEWLKAMGIEGV